MSPDDEAGNSSLKKVYKCPHCSFWASTASRFHVHIVGHLNKKPFECSLCAYRSNWRWDITKHIRLKTIRDPSHKQAHVLMNDETGRRNYTKYNKYITLMKVTEEDGDPKLMKSGEMTPNQEASLSFINDYKNHMSKMGLIGNSISDHEMDQNDQHLQDLQHSESFSSLSHFQEGKGQPPPLIRPSDDLIVDIKVEGFEKKTSFRCRKCNFSHMNRDAVLAHVKIHYQEPNKTSLVNQQYVNSVLAAMCLTQQLQQQPQQVQNNSNIINNIHNNNNNNNNNSSNQNIGTTSTTSVPSTSSSPTIVTNEHGETEEASSLIVEQGVNTILHHNNNNNLSTSTSTSTSSSSSSSTTSSSSSSSSSTPNASALRNSRTTFDVRDVVNDDEDVDDGHGGHNNNIPHNNGVNGLNNKNGGILLNMVTTSSNSTTTCTPAGKGGVGGTASSASTLVGGGVQQSPAPPPPPPTASLQSSSSPVVVGQLTNRNLQNYNHNNNLNNCNTSNNCHNIFTTTTKNNSNSNGNCSYEKDWHSGQAAPYRCGHCHQTSNWKHVIQRHCRLKHGADIRIENIDRSSDKIVYRPLLNNGQQQQSHQTSIHHHQNHHQQHHHHQQNHSMHRNPVIPAAFAAAVTGASQIKLELDTSESKAMKFKCPSCPQIFGNKSQLTIHMTLHKPDDNVDHQQLLHSTSLYNASKSKQMKCPTCHVILESKSQMNYHISLHKTSQYECHMCEYVSTKKQQLLTHMKTCHPEPHQQHHHHHQQQQQMPPQSVGFVSFCSKCPSRYLNIASLQDHFQHHGTDCAFKCEACDFSSADEKEYLAHTFSHTADYQNKTEILLRSNQMDPSNMSPAIVKTTLIKSNTEVWIVKREEEDSLLKKQLTLSLDNSPSDIKEEGLEKCSFCPFESSDGNTLQEHTQNHFTVSRIRHDFRCDHCDYTTSREDDLESHVRCHFKGLLQPPNVSLRASFEKLELSLTSDKKEILLYKEAMMNYGGQGMVTRRTSAKNNNGKTILVDAETGQIITRN